MALHLAVLAGLLAADAAVLVGVAPGWTARAADAELAAATLPAPAAGGRSVSSKTVPPPVEVVVPRLGIRSRLVGLRLQRDGSLSVPADFGRVGWWTQGAAPGERGPAVLAGHVDSKEGPAVFAPLHAARRGDVVRVRRADGRVLSYQVFKINSYVKDEFPAKDVYGPRFGDGLRLITCGGAFDEARGSYKDNLVVYARPYDEVGARRAAAAKTAVAKVAAQQAAAARVPAAPGPRPR